MQKSHIVTHKECEFLANCQAQPVDFKKDAAFSKTLSPKSKSKILSSTFWWQSHCSSVQITFEGPSSVWKSQCAHGQAVYVLRAQVGI